MAAKDPGTLLDELKIEVIDSGNHTTILEGTLPALRQFAKESGLAVRKNTCGRKIYGEDWFGAFILFNGEKRYSGIIDPNGKGNYSMMVRTWEIDGGVHEPE